MQLRSLAAITFLSTALAAGMLASPAALAQEPTIHQVYEAAEAGKFIEAQKMMDQVLAAHPNSAKAHFIQAELLAKQGKFSRAATELASAERLGPDGKFAKPEAVQRLKAVLAAAPAASARPAATPVNYGSARDVPAAERSGGLPWGGILGVGALVLLAVMFFKRKAARQAAPQGYGPGPSGFGGGAPNYPAGGMPPNYPAGGMPPQYGAPGGMPAPGGMGGLGGGIMGGLATGAALGAGMVAGQALAHHFTDSKQPERDGASHLDNGLTPGAFQNDTPPSGYDMGGNDFGVSDAGGWDSGGDSGGGGGDWD